MAMQSRIKLGGILCLLVVVVLLSNCQSQRLTAGSKKGQVEGEAPPSTGAAAPSTCTFNNAQTGNLSPFSSWTWVDGHPPKRGQGTVGAVAKPLSGSGTVSSVGQGQIIVGNVTLNDSNGNVVKQGSTVTLDAPGCAGLVSGVGVTFEALTLIASVALWDHSAVASASMSGQYSVTTYTMTVHGNIAGGSGPLPKAPVQDQNGNTVSTADQNGTASFNAQNVPVNTPLQVAIPQISCQDGLQPAIPQGTLNCTSSGPGGGPPPGFSGGPG